MKKTGFALLGLLFLLGAFCCAGGLSASAAEKGLTVITNYNGSKGTLYVAFDGYTSITNPKKGDKRLDTEKQGMLSIYKDAQEVLSTQLIHTNKAQLSLMDPGIFEVRVSFPVEAYDGSNWVDQPQQEYLSKSFFNVGNMTLSAGLSLSTLKVPDAVAKAGDSFVFTVSGMNQGGSPTKGNERFIPVKWELITSGGEVEQKGNFSGSAASFEQSVTPKAGGFYNVKVYFNWQRGDGDRWVNKQENVSKTSTSIAAPGSVQAQQAGTAAEGSSTSTGAAETTVATTAPATDSETVTTATQPETPQADTTAGQSDGGSGGTLPVILGVAAGVIIIAAIVAAAVVYYKKKNVAELPGPDAGDSSSDEQKQDSE